LKRKENKIMSKEEIVEVIDKIRLGWLLSPGDTDILCKAIWDAAIEAAAESAKSKGFTDANFECHHEVDKQSILDLKFGKI
jgi:hypothetical protein